MRCPGCGAANLDPRQYDATGMCQCTCGHRVFAGYVAEADALAARLHWLEDRVAAGDLAPDPVLAGRYAIWNPPPPRDGSPGADPAGVVLPDPSPGSPPASARARNATPGVASLLLGLGAMLLVVAGAVFAAVVWDRLGAWGQVGFMLAATVGIGALAVRLRRTLAGTAEALAVVAAGLATIDVVAAPLLGLLPAHWVEDPNAYPAAAMGLLGLGLLSLHHRFALRAWCWLGWASALAGAWLIVPAVATATFDLASRDWVPAAVTIPTLASVGMLAAGRRPDDRWEAHRKPLLTVGAFGFGISTLATAGAAMSQTHRVGALITTAAAALAVGAWAARDRGRTPVIQVGASALAGATVALVLSLPPEPQPVWLAAAVALAGFAVGLVLWILDAQRSALAAGPSVVWLAWVALRVTAQPGAATPSGLVTEQLSLLAALVGLLSFVLAWRVPALAWLGAVLGTAALALAPITWGDPLELFTLPVAALFLGAGLLWLRPGGVPSIQWLAPAVTIALVPSAVGTWLAPWAVDLSAEAISTHLLRLAALLIVTVAIVIAGTRLHLAGLLVPAAAALVILSGAQVWSGLSTLPRWTALALAGTLLVVTGARLERLRDRGRQAVDWAGALR